MADIAKYMPINGGTTVLADFNKNLFSIIKTRRTVVFLMFAFVGFTVFLALCPSSTLFSASSTTSATTASSYRSQFPSVFDYFFSNTSSSSPLQQQPSINFTSSSSSYNNADTRSNDNDPPRLPSSSSNKTQSSVLHANQTQASSSSSSPTVQPEMKENSDNQPQVSKVNQTTTTTTTTTTTAVAEKAPAVANRTENSPAKSDSSVVSNNYTASLTETDNSDEPKVSKVNQTTTTVADKTPVVANQAGNSPVISNNTASLTKKDNSDEPQVPKVNQTTTNAADKTPVIANQTGNSPVISNYTASVTNKQVKEKKEGNGSGSSGASAKQGIDNLIESLMNCDLFDGGWVKDNSYPLYKPGSCSFIDEQFGCVINGRPDKNFQKLKWKPKGCTLPRLNGGHMLELLRGKRLVFVGDSLNRNMWESLVCILKNAAKKPKNVYEAHGRSYFRGEVSYSFVFKDYNFTVEFFVSPFLVREWEMPDKNGAKKETLRLDLVTKSSDEYKSADILIFNTGHWWTHEKTSKGKDYYQEGNHVYDELNVLDAFRKALTTWATWVDANVNPMKTMVFFRGYSASHFSGGQWNSGGACDSETEPIKNETYLTPYPSKMLVLESVLQGMKTHVTYLNITRLTDFRKDGHPSVYRKHPKQHLSEDERREPLKYQDCSHWCLPGVPDSWNELLYAELLVKESKMRQHQRRAR